MERESPAKSDSQFSTADLVDEALTDRGLKQRAYTAGLDDRRLQGFVLKNAADINTVDIDERALVEQAGGDLFLAEERVEEVEAWTALLHRAMILAAGLFSLAVVVVTVALAQQGLWVTSAVLLVVGIPASLLAWFYAADWPPWRVFSRVQAARRAREDAKRAVQEAEDALKTVVVETQIKPILRTYINQHEAEQFRTTLTTVEQEGLAELEDPRYAIPTRAREQLDRFLDDMPGGSIGLSGPRGVGKTTLIRSVCPTVEGGASDSFGLVVAAPVEFEARDFLLYLFAETCRAVIGSEGVAELRKPNPTAGVLPRPYLRNLMFIVAVLLPLAGVATVLGAVVSWPPFPQVVAGALLILTGLLVWLGRLRVPWIEPVLSFRGRRRAFRFDPEIVEQAEERLQDIWYQQTFTTGWSGKLKAPIGEAGLEGSRELARQQMTLPDIAAEFRRLLSALAESRRVLIGIDELDKIESREAAHRFMNEMKILFGVENCFFLVSVSEDAMSAFERRGLPFRDVFDSSFDDIVNVGFLSVDESVELLQRRLIGMPLPFIYLCHCAAGGLARDVIRVAREVVVGNPAVEDGWPLHEACATIVATDVRAKVEASLVATRAMAAGPDVESLRSWLQRLRAVSVEPQALLDVCEAARGDLFDRFRDGDAGDAGHATSPRALACELLTFLLYSATLLELFGPTAGPKAYLQAHDSGRIDQLARARQALAVHPRAAWDCLQDFRTMTPSFTPPFPVDALPV